MNNQHTPGPWHTESNQFSIWDDKHAVAAVYNTNAPEPMATEARANAKLIAAAPELLSELQRLHDYLFTLKMMHGHSSPSLKESLVYQYTHAQEVISKATAAA